MTTARLVKNQLAKIGKVATTIGKVVVALSINYKNENYEKSTLISIFLTFAFTSWAQETTIVEAKGVGLKREDALQDALRNAVGQAVGITVSSQTQVENFMVLSDAISSKTEGYITNYEIIKETPFKDRFEIDIKPALAYRL